MRRATLFALSFAILMPLSAATFEGNVTYEIHTPEGKIQPLNYQIKSPDIRMNMEIPGQGESAMLFVPKENSMYVLMPARKMAIKQPLPEAPAAKSKPTAERKFDLTKTNRKETIAGRECTVFTFKSDVTEGEMCNAEGLGTFYFGAGGNGAQAPAWASEVRSKGYFPLRMTNKDLRSDKTMTMIATKIEPKSLPSSLFKVPSDYKVTEGMGGMSPHAGGAAASSQADIAKKMMNATPEEREKMIEEMKKAYGAPAN